MELLIYIKVPKIYHLTLNVSGKEVDEKVLEFLKNIDVYHLL